MKRTLLIFLLCFSTCLFGQQRNISVSQIHELKELSVDNPIKLPNASALSSDGANKLWVATSQGVLVYEGDNQTLTPIEGTPQNAWLNYIFRSSDGTIWVSNQNDDDLIQISPQGQVTRFPEMANVRFVLEYENKLYLGGDQGALFVKTAEKGFEPILIGFPASPPNIMDFAFWEDSMYVASDKGVFVFAIPQSVDREIVPRQLNEDHVESIAIDKEGIIWFSTVKGLAKLENEDLGKQAFGSVEAMKAPTVG